MSHPLDIVDKLAEELRSLPPISQEQQQKLSRKFRLEFNYNSNHIEGNTLTYGETELLLMFDDTRGNHTLREYEEMKAHDVAYKMIEDWAKEKERSITEQNIKNLNEIILVRPFWKDAITQDGQKTQRQITIGNYKEYPNSVRLSNGEIFEYASPMDTPIQMQELIDWYRAEEGGLHPVTLSAMFHYKFVRIHPFDDGNGRIARLIMNYVLLRNDLPPVIIKSDDKNNYLHALHQADIGNYEPFIQYVAEQLIWSLEIAIQATRGDDIEEVSDLKKEISILSRRVNAENKQSKHPGIIYDTFKWFSKDVWKVLKHSFSEFNGLISETKEFHSVNLMDETYEKKNILEHPFVKSTGPAKVRIFGHDIYDVDVDEVEWRLVLYGIKGAKEKQDLEIRTKLKFNVDQYSITAQVEYSTIVNIDFVYGDYMLKADIEKMQHQITKQVFDLIKKRIG